MTPRLILRVLGRLGVAPPALDLDGLSRVYGAWCERVPFDNVHKLLHFGAKSSGDLPGSTASAFFETWLDTNIGGTCWAGNGALHDLLSAVGFSVERVAATMMSREDQPPCNHGSVLVHLGGERYITDASILSGVPLRIPSPGEPPSPTLPRIERRGAHDVILWRTQRAPDGFPCRIDRIGITAERFHTLHQHTATWSPFNFAVSARIHRAGRTLGYGTSQLFTIDASGTLITSPADRAARDRFLVETLNISSALVAGLPDDRDITPAPADWSPLPP